MPAALSLLIYLTTMVCEILNLLAHFRNEIEGSRERVVKHFPNSRNIHNASPIFKKILKLKFKS